MKERSLFNPMRNFVVQLGGKPAIIHFKILIGHARLRKVDVTLGRCYNLLGFADIVNIEQETARSTGDDDGGSAAPSGDAKIWQPSAASN